MAPPHLHWFLPTTGDGREVVGRMTSFLGGPSKSASFRAPTLDYLTQVALAAEHVGFEAVLTPTGTQCPDAWILTAALIPRTSRLKFLVAFRPGLITPTLAAQQALTFQQLSGGRLLLNIVNGGESEEQQRFGDFADKATRYARAGEFLEIIRGAWSGAPFDFDGEHYTVRGATTSAVPEPQPEIFFGGASPEARDVAAAQVDTYLTWTEPPSVTGALFDDLRERAKRHGRELSFGIRAHVIARDTTEEAWAVADKLLAAMDPKAIEAARARLAQSESEGQRRQLALNSDLGRLQPHPGLWAGYGLIRPGAGTALVGSHAEVAALIREYQAVGAEHFILSGQPHIEEAYWFGEGVIPLLKNQVG